MKNPFSRYLPFFLVFGILLLVAGCSNPEKEKAEAFDKAMAYVEKGENKAAIIELKNAIQIDPKYAQPAINSALFI